MSQRAQAPAVFSNLMALISNAHQNIVWFEETSKQAVALLCENCLLDQACFHDTFCRHLYLHSSSLVSCKIAWFEDHIEETPCGSQSALYSLVY